MPAGMKNAIWHFDVIGNSLKYQVHVFECLVGLVRPSHSLMQVK